MRLARVFQTLRYLKRSQIFWQVVRRLQKKFENPARLLSVSPSSADWHLGAGVGKLTVGPPVPEQEVSRLANREFRFLNRTVAFHSEIDWECKDVPRLWRYNLHYFDWLWSFRFDIDADWQTACSFVQDWIRKHPPDRNATGWEPYPTSLRIINWSLLFLVLWREKTLADLDFTEQLTGSLFRQSRWLSKRLERHILANHFWENGVALLTIGRLMNGVSARSFERIGNKICQQQLREQILEDGLHYERSAMYHHRTIWLVKVMAQLGNEEETINRARQTLPRMEAALDALTHSDGSLVLFNDAANHIYSASPIGRNPEWMDCVWALKDAGYYGAKNSRGDSIAFDYGKVGPEYQPGHAHADTFTFEWYIKGIPFITDTGTLEYEIGENRLYDRSTPAHNTVCINGKNSSDVWGGFRVGTRCIPGRVTWRPNKKGFILEGEHTGFKGWRHFRRVTYEHDLLRIEDQLSGLARANCLHSCISDRGLRSIAWVTSTSQAAGLSRENFIVRRSSFNRSY